MFFLLASISDSCAWDEFGKASISDAFSISLVWLDTSTAPPTFPPTSTTFDLSGTPFASSTSSSPSSETPPYTRCLCNLSRSEGRRGRFMRIAAPLLRDADDMLAHGAAYAIQMVNLKWPSELFAASQRGSCHAYATNSHLLCLFAIA